MDLYSNEKNAEEFSATRKSNWKGWDKLYNSIMSYDTPKILDLGCGNGRFINWLLSNKIAFLRYIGVDYSDTLLKIASRQFNEEIYLFHKVNFLNKDWKNKLNDEKYSVIVSFGVTHHLETVHSRENFFENIFNLLENDGIAVVSFWGFDQLPIMKTATKLSENLYRLKFGKFATRTCYLYPEIEIKKYLENFEIVEEYFADAKNNRGNHYFILRKPKIA